MSNNVRLYERVFRTSSVGLLPSLLFSRIDVATVWVLRCCTFAQGGQTDIDLEFAVVDNDAEESALEFDDFDDDNGERDLELDDFDDIEFCVTVAALKLDDDDDGRSRETDVTEGHDKTIGRTN
jgi:hypothetical protein